MVALVRCDAFETELTISQCRAPAGSMMRASDCALLTMFVSRI
jgi:hypothetical protein